MPGGLPEGLVSNKAVVSGEIRRVDRVEAEDVQKLWRVYSTKKAALADNVGSRLENFFWRIWSSRRIRQRITGTEVARQFNSINEGGYIRTTPTPSPRSSRSLNSYYRAARSRTSPISSASQAPASPTGAGILSTPREDEASSVTPTPTSPLAAGAQCSARSKHGRRSTTSVQPPPILKKSSSGSVSGLTGKSSKIAAISPASSRNIAPSPPAENDEAVVFDDSPMPTESTLAPSGRPASNRRSTATRFNEEVAVSIPKPSTTVIRSAREKTGRSSSGESIQKSGKRNPVVVANTAASRTRPAMGRRKSSGTSSLGNSRTSSCSHLARSPKSRLSGPRDMSSQEAEAATAKQARGASPHPSKSRIPLPPDPSSSEDSSKDSDEGEEAAQRPTASPKGKSKAIEENSESSGEEMSEAPKPLVDPYFRSKFIGKTRSAQGSFANLPSLLRKSAAAAPTSASYQAASMMESRQPTTSAGRGKGRDAFRNVTAPLKAPATAGPEEFSDDDPQPLPRTKSQLTLLLEREKNRSTTHEA
ncbi:hypothetical protein N7G274_003508 [Stereocaulon virgatum]|uniref:Nitrogen regulatory protein areA GATA-like domain-containing protein n=1 Tax=Stereocaulon virgatum TaxID=373712 RepID=A0ABR4AKM8_9LECA